MVGMESIMMRSISCDSFITPKVVRAPRLMHPHVRTGSLAPHYLAGTSFGLAAKPCRVSCRRTRCEPEPERCRRKISNAIFSSPTLLLRGLSHSFSYQQDRIRTIISGRQSYLDGLASDGFADHPVARMRSTNFRPNMSIDRIWTKFLGPNGKSFNTLRAAHTLHWQTRVTLRVRHLRTSARGSS